MSIALKGGVVQDISFDMEYYPNCFGLIDDLLEKADALVFRNVKPKATVSKDCEGDTPEDYLTLDL